MWVEIFMENTLKEVKATVEILWAVKKEYKKY